jgi:hypothetical protein
MARQANEDITRLPKWAQDRITNAEAHVTSLKARLAEVSGQHEGSNVAVDGHHVYPDVTLPNNSGILFYLGSDRDRWKNTVEIQVREKQGKIGLEIRGADKGIRLIPSSYNSVRLMLDD